MLSCTSMVRGDDYVSSGPADSLTWFDQELCKKYKVKTQRIRRHSDCCKAGTLELMVLNRIAKWTQHGYGAEADPRHSELVVDGMLEPGDRAVAIPGLDEKELMKMRLLNCKESRPRRAGRSRLGVTTSARTGRAYYLPRKKYAGRWQCLRLGHGDA